MKSAVISVTSEGQGIIEALSMTERFGEESELSKKNILHLRLLAEELFGILKGIAGSVEASYWLDTKEKDFELHMKSEVNMSMEMREQFLSASSKGENEAAKGFMGKLRDMIAEMLLSAQETLPYTIDTTFLCPIEGVSADYLWSMSYYTEMLKKNVLDAEKADDAWDKLEKSIVASIADDIKVKIKGRNVEIILYKNF